MANRDVSIIAGHRGWRPLHFIFLYSKNLCYILRYNNLRPQHGSLFFLLILKICFLKMLVCVCVCVCVYSIKGYRFQHIFPPLFLFLLILLYFNILCFAILFIKLTYFAGRRGRRPLLFWNCQNLHFHWHEFILKWH